MNWLMLLALNFDTNGGGGVVILWDSVDEAILSLDTDHVFVDGYVVRNIVFVGLVDFTIFV